MFISIIVATYNREKLLRSSLQSLLRLETGSKFYHEIVVIDNSSTDDTKAVVEELSKSAPVSLKYFIETAPGVAFARNKGVRKASGDWIAFFDDDQIADPNWLKELVAVVLTTGSSCVGGRIQLLLPEKASQLSPVCRALLGALDLGDKPTILPAKRLPGTGNVLIKRKLFDYVGQFDESFTMGCEDADLFRRIRRKGFELWYAPKAVAYHVIPEYRLKKQYFTWSSLRDGVNYAYLDRKEGGIVTLICACILRIGQALLVNLTRFCMAELRKDNAEAMGHRCLLSRTYGYARETLFLIAPKIFPQGQFFFRLEFRNERQTFSARSDNLGAR